jgi:hypothetical protein
MHPNGNRKGNVSQGNLLSWLEVMKAPYLCANSKQDAHISGLQILAFFGNG